MPSWNPNKVIADAKWILCCWIRSNLLVMNVCCLLENCWIFASGTSIPQLAANWCNTISHAPASLSSLALGNLAIQRLPFSSVTLALGLAPPNEDPGSTNKFNHCAYSGSFTTSSLSNWRLAYSNSLIEVHGGAAICFWLFKKSPFSSNLKRKPPIRFPSKTPNKKSLSKSVLSSLSSFFADHASLLRINSLPQRSGDESKNNPKLLFSSGRYCLPLYILRFGSKNKAWPLDVNHVSLYSKENISLPRTCCGVNIPICWTPPKDCQSA